MPPKGIVWNDAPIVGGAPPIIVWNDAPPAKLPGGVVIGGAGKGAPLGSGPEEKGGPVGGGIGDVMVGKEAMLPVGGGETKGGAPGIVGKDATLGGMEPKGGPPKGMVGNCETDPPM